MHESVRQFIAGQDIVGPVLEVGSYNVNGTVRDLCPDDYIGIDIVAGPDVDLIYDGDTIPFHDGQFATVLSLEVFEHAKNPNRLAAEIMRVLRPGGTAFITARGVGFPYHNPPDRWRYMEGALSELFAEYGDVTETPDPHEPGWLVTATKRTT